MITPQYGLTIAYWAHLLATVVWIGGLVGLNLFVVPAARKSLAPEQYARLLNAIQPRIQQTGWFCLTVLIFTGLFQMVSHPNYQGFLVIDSTWAEAILIKHLLVAGMILVSGYMTWWMGPALQRMATLQAHGKPIDEALAERLRSREANLLQLNLLLSVVVLALTALARSS
jgi:uncharacterized membrane protein